MYSRMVIGKAGVCGRGGGRGRWCAEAEMMGGLCRGAIFWVCSIAEERRAVSSTGVSRMGEMISS